MHLLPAGSSMHMSVTTGVAPGKGLPSARMGKHIAFTIGDAKRCAWLNKLSLLLRIGYAIPKELFPRREQWPSKVGNMIP